ncbi:MAG: acyltransferase [Patescibacteria group bacterium]
MDIPSYIHPTADISDRAEIGSGTKVWHHVQIMEDVKIGNECVLGKGVFLSGPTRVGNRVKIQNYANIFGAIIEDEVLIGPLSVIVHDNNPRSTNLSGNLKTAAEYTSKYVTLKFGSSIGANVVILPGVTIGEFAMVAAGSVVHRNVASYALVVGNPARQLGHVCSCGFRLDSGLVCERCQRVYQPHNNGLIAVPEVTQS